MRHKKSLRATALLGREAGVRLSREPHFNEDQPRRIRALAAATQTPVLRSPSRAQPGEDSSSSRPQTTQRPPATGACFAWAGEGAGRPRGAI